VFTFSGLPFHSDPDSQSWQARHSIAPPPGLGGGPQVVDLNNGVNGDDVQLPAHVLNAEVPNAPMDGAVMVDALTAIAQTLVGLQQSNDLHLRANEYHQNQHDRRAQEQAIRAARKEWLDEEAIRVSTCEGLPKPTMRSWLKAVTAAIGRFPDRGLRLLPTDPQHAGGIEVMLGRKLITRTARGDLLAQADRWFDRGAAGGIKEALASFEEAFLGGQDNMTLRAELEELRQLPSKKPEHQLPAYCRTFLARAETAYGIVRRSEEDEQKLADMFITSIASTDMAKELFNNNPPLCTLIQAQNRALALNERAERMNRAWKNRRSTMRREEPMEMGPLESVGVQSLQLKVKELEERLNAAHAAQGQSQTRAASASNSGPQGGRGSNGQSGGKRGAPARGGACFECNLVGHFGRECTVRAARLAAERAERERVERATKGAHALARQGAREVAAAETGVNGE